MKNNRVLIAYGTRMSVTKENSLEIADVLRNKFDLSVDVVNLKNSPSLDIENYSNVIVGSGIRMGKWTKESLEFLKSIFENKRVAIFVSSVEAGDDKTYQKAFSRYILEILSKNPHFMPVATAAFGGRIMLKGLIFVDNRNIVKVREWAFNLGEIFRN
ncbi:MAG: flavodoxin domain-containing protein [Candidatus Hodarchaeales archaeon]|jgi:menaquinone-dependent protoporphyrinogen oxidase